jgi:hypothetical protein
VIPIKIQEQREGFFGGEKWENHDKILPLRSYVLMRSETPVFLVGVLCSKGTLNLDVIGQF